jgi:hypothetical protein
VDIRTAAEIDNLMHEIGTGFNIIIENPSDTLHGRPGFQDQPISGCKLFTEMTKMCA